MRQFAFHICGWSVLFFACILLVSANPNATAQDLEERGGNGSYANPFWVKETLDGQTAYYWERGQSFVDTSLDFLPAGFTWETHLQQHEIERLYDCLGPTPKVYSNTGIDNDFKVSRFYVQHAINPMNFVKVGDSSSFVQKVMADYAHQERPDGLPHRWKWIANSVVFSMSAATDGLSGFAAAVGFLENHDYPTRNGINDSGKTDILFNLSYAECGGWEFTHNLQIKKLDIIAYDETCTTSDPISPDVPDPPSETFLDWVIGFRDLTAPVIDQFISLVSVDPLPQEPLEGLWPISYVREIYDQYPNAIVRP